MRNLSQYPVTQEEKVALVTELLAAYNNKVSRTPVGELRMGETTGVVLAAILEDLATLDRVKSEAEDRRMS